VTLLYRVVVFTLTPSYSSNGSHRKLSYSITHLVEYSFTVFRKQKKAFLKRFLSWLVRLLFADR